MQTIVMTPEQTSDYDSGDDMILHEMLYPLLKQAQELADETQEIVDIYTYDDILVQQVFPEPPVSDEWS